MKQTAALLLAILLSVFGCSDSSQDTAGKERRRSADSETAAASSGAAQDDYLKFDAGLRASKPWRIAFVLKSLEEGNIYWQRVRAGAEKSGKQFGVQVQIYLPQSDQYDIALQSGLLQGLMQSHPDGIILAPIHSQQLVDDVEKAIADGTPVLIFDTPLQSTKPLTQLSSDNEKTAYEVSRWTLGQISEGAVAILEGPDSSDNAVARRRGFLRAIKNSRLKIAASESANWKRSEARTITLNWLKKYNDIKAIIAASDQMALGAASAVEESGRRNILISGIDANPDALEAIKAGRIYATIDQQPLQQAMVAVQLMIRHLDTGVTYPAVSHWPLGRPITRASLNDKEKQAQTEK